MEDFNQFLTDKLINLPMQGLLFTWHNCSDDNGSLWKRLDRILVNDRWLDRWSSAAYTSLPPRTFDHSPLVLYGNPCMSDGNIFQFDNYLAASPNFIPSVNNVWRHNIVGTTTRKLKALKQVFQTQMRNKGDLSLNVKLAAEFLSIAQTILQDAKHDSLLICLEYCGRIVYLKAVKLE
ncbi:UNVERIFIED_CONTAM: hypothetical protein Slati_2234300 [Sesamum latifolium]|uniref:Uncharacterized protein n=1 Tax=Sesamum latifolium TaxID=2727402 RepID=A0AAW2WV06_9LAMI